jgi:thiol-disulfide isomerase/thioredoxin
VASETTIAVAFAGALCYPGHVKTDDSEHRESRVKATFLFASAMAIVAFLLVQVVLGESRSATGDGRVKSLMASIRAEIVDTPLTSVQASWPLTTDSGETFTLSSLPRDTVVFLNFWATWCPPCREEMPSMLQLREALADRRFMMVAVSYDETWGEIRDFFTRWLGRQPAPQQLFGLKDEKLEPGETLRETFGTTAMPDTYVIYNGQILTRFVNARHWTDPAIVEYFQQLAPIL